MIQLVIPQPRHLGSIYAESLHSLVMRTAMAYQVPLSECCRLASSAVSDEPKRFYYKTLQDWVSQGMACSQLVDGLELISGRSDIRLTTLQFLRIGQSRKLVARQLRLCPLCVHPRDGCDYGMLAHQMVHVRQCPLHGCKLVDRCRCGKFFTIGQLEIAGRRCRQCGEGLWEYVEKATWMDTLDKWRQEQVLSLVEYSTGMERLSSAEDWLIKFNAGMTELLNCRTAYAKADRWLVREIVKRARKNPEARPSLNTLISVAAMQAKNVIDFIQAPAAALTPRLLDIGNVTTGREKRKAKNNATTNRAKKLLKDLLALTEEAELPSLRSVLRQAEIDSTVIWRSDPKLLRRYCEERQRRKDWANDRVKRKAQFEAHRLVTELVQRGSTPEIRRHGREVMITTGATKEVAEQAMRAVLLGWSAVVDIPQT